MSHTRGYTGATGQPGKPVPSDLASALPGVYLKQIFKDVKKILVTHIKVLFIILNKM